MAGNLFLIGFMGCGKSTLAREMAGRYGLKVIEMDQEIEKREGMTISEIFRTKGEEHFRQCETQLLKDLKDSKGQIISCGGGTAMREENVKLMKESGTILWLKVKAETVYHRLKNQHDRPLLEGNMNVDYIENLIQQRKPKYEAAMDAFIEVDHKDMKILAAEAAAYL